MRLLPMALEGYGQPSDRREQGTAPGQQGRASGQRGTASGNRGTAEDRIALELALNESARDTGSRQDDGDSSQDSDEEDRISQAASVACTADSSMDVVVIMTDKVPVCLLCSFRADSPNPLLVLVLDAEVSYRPWMSYNKVYTGRVVNGKKPTGCVCRICGNVYKTAGFMSESGKITDYKKPS